MDQQAGTSIDGGARHGRGWRREAPTAPTVARGPRGRAWLCPAVEVWDLPWVGEMEVVVGFPGRSSRAATGGDGAWAEGWGWPNGGARQRSVAATTGDRRTTVGVGSRFHRSRRWGLGMMMVGGGGLAWWFMAMGGGSGAEDGGAGGDFGQKCGWRWETLGGEPLPEMEKMGEGGGFGEKLLVFF